MPLADLPHRVTEVLEVAENLEAMAAATYLRAAEACHDEDVRDSLTRLAEMEQRHLETLRRIHSSVQHSDDSAGRHGESLEIFEAWLEGFVFAPIDDLAREVESIDSIDGWLRTTISMEKESITYYTGLRAMVDVDTRSLLDAMISEELEHLVTLGRLLREVTRHSATA